MKHKKTLLCSLLLISCLILVTSMPVFAAELTEAEVQQAVDAQGKERSPVMFLSGFCVPLLF